jgi:serine/threonine protein kinase
MFLYPYSCVCVHVSARALSLSHTHKQTHTHKTNASRRDIKPANIMVTTSAPFVKLIDFGFARMLHADASGQLPPEESKIIGTPMYWAPEQTFARNTVTPALDLWAMGVLMFHISSGVLPFSSHNGKLMQIAAGIRTKPARDLNAITQGRVSQRFCLVCHRLLSKDPAVRPQTADEVLSNLLGISDPSLSRPEAFEAIAGRLVSAGNVYGWLNSEWMDGWVGG